MSRSGQQRGRTGDWQMPGTLSAAGHVGTGGAEMAAIVVKGNAKPTGLAGIAGLRAKACGMLQRAMAYTAAAVLVCAAGAALLQLGVQMLSFPAPIAVTGITVMAAVLLNSLRRYLRMRAATGKARESAWRPAVSPPGWPRRSAPEYRGYPPRPASPPNRASRPDARWGAPPPRCR